MKESVDPFLILLCGPERRWNTVPCSLETLEIPSSPAATLDLSACLVTRVLQEEFVFCLCTTLSTLALLILIMLQKNYEIT